MQFLAQTTPFPDETIESYLLRLSQDNGYLGYSDMADILWDWLASQDIELDGAFPNDLKSVDVYKAAESSNFRIRALRLVAQLAGIEASCLLNLCWLRSNTQFGSLTSVSRHGLLVPRQLLRTFGVPVCVECLKERPYVPFLWHLKPYKACHVHELQLTRACSSCDAEIDYRASEAFLECQCGAQIHKSNQADVADLKLANVIAGLSAQKLVGLIVWFSIKSSLSVDDAGFSEGFTHYFSSWPSSLMDELRNASELGKIKQLRPFNHTPFGDVFGSLLKDSKVASAGSTGHNLVQAEIVQFLARLVQEHPKKKHPNMGDLLLSLADAAILLGTNTEQVFRLYEEGFLAPATPLKKHELLRPYDAVFYLRQVIELQQSFAPSSVELKPQFVSPW